MRRTVLHKNKADRPKAVSSRGLIIPANILSMDYLTLTSRLVLAEIVDLHKVSQRVFASCAHFAQRLGVSVRSIGDAIKQLKDHSLVVRVSDPQSSRKGLLKPTLPDDVLQDVELKQDSLSVTTEAAESAPPTCNIHLTSMQNLHRRHANSADVKTNINLNSNLNTNPLLQTPSAVDERIENKKGSFACGSTNPSSPLVAPPPSSPTSSSYALVKPEVIVMAESAFEDELPHWKARPRDAEMVNEYMIRTKHPSQGKGHLFFDYYESIGWVIGRNRLPCSSWKSLLRNFDFNRNSKSAGGSEKTHVHNRPTVTGINGLGSAGFKARQAAAKSRP